MSMAIFVRVMVTLSVLGALSMISWMFDAWIDNRRPEDRYDGDTAIWVMVGTAYTIVAWAIILTVWLGWNMSGPGAALLLTCFIFSGVPMYFGEAERSRKKRNDNGFD